MPQWMEMAIAVFCAVAASSGFWTFVQRRHEKKDAKARMMLGLGHDRIVYLGLLYIERGSISKDEYENLHDYLYLPYVELGGNGVAKKIMDTVKTLPIRASTINI